LGGKWWWDKFYGRCKQYTRIFCAWLVKSHIPHFLDESMEKLMGHGSRAFVFSWPNLGQRMNTWFSMACPFFDSHNLLLFCWKNLNIVKTKLRASLQEILHSHHSKGSLDAKIVNSFLQVEMDYNCTFSKKAREFAFSAMEGVTCISWNFTFTLVIVSNLHHVDSLPQLENKKLVIKNCNKLNYRQTTQVQKTSTLWKAFFFKEKKEKKILFIIVCEPERIP
jgi:hypothetical protein